MAKAKNTDCFGGMGSTFLGARGVGILAIMGLWFWSTSFILLFGSLEARLPVTLDDPEAEFFWDGKAPNIEPMEDVFRGKSNKAIMRMLLERSLKQWSDIPGSFVKLKLSGVKGKVRKAKPNDKLHSITMKSSLGDTVAALAFPTVNPSNPSEIYDCDVVISSRRVSSDELHTTLAHEIGHCVGLGHPHATRQALMSYTNSEPKLSADDMAGAIYLYPASGARKERDAFTRGCASALATGDAAMRMPTQELGGGLWSLLGLLLFAPALVLGVTRWWGGSRRQQAARER